MNEKWLKSGNIYRIENGGLEIKNFIDPGVYVVGNDPNPRSTELVLHKKCDSFSFDFKLYDLDDCNKFLEFLEKTWNSKELIESNKNLGIILNGLKGTGKSIFAKVLCNKLGLPVLIIQNNSDALENFLSSINFNCIILIDEMEKIFSKHSANSETLLKIIDGVYSGSRKFFIMTTNSLDQVNPNLLGRPGRVKYIKHFKNLNIELIKNYLIDNLNDSSKTEEILRYCNGLVISTIDILKCIVEEFNIHGALDEDLLNIEKNVLKINCITSHAGSDIEDLEEFKKLVPESIINKKTWEIYSGTEIDGESRESKLWNLYGIDYEDNIPVNNLDIKLNDVFVENNKKVIMEPDQNGYFILKSLDGLIYCKLLKKNKQSLYEITV